MLVTAWVPVLVGLCIMHSKLNSEAWILHDMYRWVENAKSIPKNLVLVNWDLMVVHVHFLLRRKAMVQAH